MNVPKGFRNRDRYPISTKHDSKYKTVKYQLLLGITFFFFTMGRCLRLDRKYVLFFLLPNGILCNLHGDTEIDV
jgi:hypothetical protein